MQETVKLRKVASSLVITLPKRLIEDLGWGDGDMLVLNSSEQQKSVKVSRERTAVFAARTPAPPPAAKRRK